jgi:hypothetical protein
MPRVMLRRPIELVMEAGDGVNREQARARGRGMESRAGMTRWGWTAVFAVSIALLSLLTVYLQLRELGLEYLEAGNQISRHRDVLLGAAGNPWQYRILTVYMLEGIIRVLQYFGVAHGVSAAFIAFRLLQNAGIFLAASIYYRRLGLNRRIVLLGLILLGWAMTHAYFDSDLQFSTYADVFFYLLAAIAILSGRTVFIVPIALLASLNRETALLIPLMLFAVMAKTEPVAVWRSPRIVMVVSLGVSIAVLAGLRVVLPPQGLVLPYGHALGEDLLSYNIRRLVTWVQLMATMSLLPMVALLGYRQWPRELKVFFWVIVPAWFGVHFLASVMAETRLVLVPLAVVLLPGALFYLGGKQSDSTPDGRRWST